MSRYRLRHRATSRILKTGGVLEHHTDLRRPDRQSSIKSRRQRCGGYCDQLDGETVFRHAPCRSRATTATTLPTSNTNG